MSFSNIRVNNQEILSFDTAPTSGSSNLINSDSIYNSELYIKNTKHIYTDIFQGNINNGEIYNGNLLYYHTNLLPIKNGRGYLIGNITKQTAHYFSAPYFNSESYLGGNYGDDESIPSGAKYVSYTFYNIPSYEPLTIISRKDVDDFLGNTCFEVNSEFDGYDTLLTKKLLNLLKYGIKGFYFYGTSVDVTKQYNVQFVKWDGSEFRLLLLDGSTRVLDKTFAIPNKIIDTTLSSDTGNYNLRIILDLSGIETNTFLNAGGSYNFRTKVNAYSSFIGNIKTIESDVYNIKTVVPVINDSNYIDVETKELYEEDYIDYLSSSKGAEDGYVLAKNGISGVNNDMTRTDYIEIGKIKYIKVKTPAASQAGGCFYTGNDPSLFETQYISGFASGSGGDGNTWIIVPKNARYFRTTVAKSDINSGTAVLKVKKAIVEPLQDFVDRTDANPRQTHILYGYEGFVKGVKNGSTWQRGTEKINAREELILNVQDNDARQILSQQTDFFNRTKYEVTFDVVDANSFFGIGVGDGMSVCELRIHNSNDSCLFEIYAGYGSGDTAPRVVISRTMSFAITAGNIYKLGIKRIENESYNNVEHMDGVIYYIQSYSDNVTYEEFVPRNNSQNNGIRNGFTGDAKGIKYVSLKVGDVIVDNIFYSSPYNPQAKILMIGDSFTDGDTLINTDPETHCGQKNKLACLLQSAIGDDCFVIAGRGGDGAGQGSFPYQTREIDLFLPKYIIIQFGSNHGDYTGFVEGMTRLINYMANYGIQPVLMTPVPANGRSSEITVQMCEWVRESGYMYADTSKAVTVDGLGETWKPGYVNADGTHPSVVGHQALFEAFARELPELFEV